MKFTPGELLQATAIYMRKRFRGVFKIYFEKGLAYRADKRIFTTERTFDGNMERQKFIYAMAGAGKHDYSLFACPTTLKGNPGPDYYALGLGRFDVQHSSFLKGQPVLCAGNIEFIDGVLVRIDNGSGHYKPRPSDLFRAVGALVRKHKIDLTKVLRSARGYEVAVRGWAPGGADVTFDLRDLVDYGAIDKGRPGDVMPIQVQVTDTNIKDLDPGNHHDVTWWLQYRLQHNLPGAWH
jgi:hypothetical protein